jgi:hypothetical protein
MGTALIVFYNVECVTYKKTRIVKVLRKEEIRKDASL